MADDYDGYDKDSWGLLEMGSDDQEDMTMSEFMTSRIFAVLSAITVAVTSLILDAGELMMRPVRAVTGGLSDMIGSTFVETVTIIEAGASQAAWSIENGATALFGPATFPIAVATVIAGLYVLAIGWERMNWNPMGWLTSRFR